MMMGYIPEGKGLKGDWGGEKFIHPTKRALQYPLIWQINFKLREIH